MSTAGRCTICGCALDDGLVHKAGVCDRRGLPRRPSTGRVPDLPGQRTLWESVDEPDPADRGQGRPVDPSTRRQTEWDRLMEERRRKAT